MDFILGWYAVLSRVFGALAGPITGLADAINVPLATALLLGLLGSTSPCQLTANGSALAYVARRAGSGGLPLRLAAAYTAGKVAVLGLGGSAAILAGVKLGTETIPVFIVARKAIGPLMIIVGLYLLGVVTVRYPVGALLRAVAGGARRRGDGAGAFLLGAAYSFGFCPTLFLLFFGVVLPLRLQTPGGWLLPPLFAVGTALPLIALAYGLVYVSPTLHHGLKRLAGVVFLLAGLNDTVVYWLL